MPKTQEVTMYVAPTGEAFALLSHSYPSDGQLLYSPDGRTFYALGVRGAKGRFVAGKMDANITFIDPRNGVSGELHLVNDSIEYDGVEYVKQGVFVNMLSVVPLPLLDSDDFDIVEG